MLDFGSCYQVDIHDIDGVSHTAMMDKNGTVVQEEKESSCRTENIATYSVILLICNCRILTFINRK